MSPSLQPAFARRIPRPLLLAVVTLAAAATPALASACTIMPYPAEFPLNPSLVAPSPPPAPRLASVSLKRARYAPPGNGDCGDVGHLALRFVQADGSPWPTDYGIRLTVTSDTPPGPFTIPIYPMATTDGALFFGAGDDPSLPIDFKLAAVAVNAAWVESAPIEIRVSHAGRGGCSMSGGAGRSPFAVIALLAFGGLLVVRMRRRPTR